MANRTEAVAVSGNSQRLFQLIRNTGGRRIGVTETITGKHGPVIHNKQQRLDRWAEHFGEQLSWPSANTTIPVVTPVAP